MLEPKLLWGANTMSYINFQMCPWIWPLLTFQSQNVKKAPNTVVNCHYWTKYYYWSIVQMNSGIKWHLRVNWTICLLGAHLGFCWNYLPANRDQMASDRDRVNMGSFYLYQVIGWPWKWPINVKMAKQSQIWVLIGLLITNFTFDKLFRTICPHSDI